MRDFSKRSNGGIGAGQAGQSTIELALIIPLLMAMLLGGFNTTMLISDKLIANYAVRQGARLAAELGGKQTNPSATQIQIDQKIVRNVMAVASGMRYATVQEIDIYQASSIGGWYVSGNLIDQFDGAGNPLSGGFQTFTLDKRVQTPPNETPIGIRIQWQFTNPAPRIGTSTYWEYAVMTAAPVLN
ncbi:MAG TPA: TadE/TadG family type IV pilus assembly protein [Candidatus Dormibacteraeota bacterium]